MSSPMGTQGINTQASGRSRNQLQDIVLVSAFVTRVCVCVCMYVFVCVHEQEAFDQQLLIRLSILGAEETWNK
jgi:hypothetical protein